MTRPMPLRLYLSSALQLAVRYRPVAGASQEMRTPYFAGTQGALISLSPCFLISVQGCSMNSGVVRLSFWGMVRTPSAALADHYCKILQGIVPRKASRDLHVSSHESLASHAPEAIAARSLVVFLIFTANIEFIEIPCGSSANRWWVDVVLDHMDRRRFPLISNVGPFFNDEEAFDLNSRCSSSRMFWKHISVR